jgi:Carboxypeptidase regulatory-like domain
MTIGGSLSGSGNGECLEMRVQKMAVFVFCFFSFPWSFLLAGPTVSAFAAHQFQQSGSLVGQIRDKTGAVVANAIVELYAQSGEKILETRSSEDGTFSFSGVQAGDYLVKVTIPGFGVTGARADVRFGESSRLEIMINPEEVSSSSSASTEPPVYNALFFTNPCK